ncbi:MAG: ABC transporter permease [Acidobacteria bacterium]|nr:ABC transporter permease [Acidobacteriota bacterium]
MSGFMEQFRLSLVLHFRNRMALFYGYLFPVIFLVAFWVLYRHELVPIARHLGELLTVGVLGGACFGLPTTMVSERERGVWRCYRLAPVSTWSVVASVVAARYVLLLTAGLLQITLAMIIGMPAPAHVFGIWVAFTCVAFAFLGLGLMIAMMADNVPAVQALGQCIFLPMLIIGGVAVPLASLPPWAQYLSAFFPGRYAVEALQANVTGDGLDQALFSLLALTVIGAAGWAAGAGLFRWDAGERFAGRPGKPWVMVAVVGAVAVGVAGGSRGVWQTMPLVESATDSTAQLPTGVTSAPNVAPAPSALDDRSGQRRSAAMAPGPTPIPVGWQTVTLQQINAGIDFSRLPPDDGVVTPIALPEEAPGPETVIELELIRSRLPQWKPGLVTDPFQRVRNHLFVAIVPDLFQMPTERFVPHIVFDRLKAVIPKDDLIKILYWIALHPDEGDDTALDELHPFGFGNGPSDVDDVRDRTSIYAVKLLGRLLGKIQGHSSVSGICVAVCAIAQYSTETWPPAGIHR